MTESTSEPSDMLEKFVALEVTNAALAQEVAEMRKTQEKVLETLSSIEAAAAPFLAKVEKNPMVKMLLGGS